MIFGLVMLTRKMTIKIVILIIKPKTKQKTADRFVFKMVM